MNQHLLVKIRQLGTPHRCVANLGKTQNTRCAHGASFRLAKAGPVSEAQPMSGASALAGAIAQRGPRSALAIGPYLRLAP